ncbi:MAG: hypothetical protein QY316_08640 [Thermodesulfobacteriota bacterium]|nr:MAG: hypothetical protein QY316_08640 [Thermodesulfobacteriota bacterium]
MQEHGGENAITRGERRFVALWSALILLLYAIYGAAAVSKLLHYRSEAERTQSYAFGSAPAGPSVQPESEFGQVVTGIYVNHIGEFSVREGGWAADFDIWFRWAGSEVNPAERFRVVNGEVDSSQKIESYVRRGEGYERYRVKARFTKDFDSGRFPYSDEILTIQIEDAVQGAQALSYVADETGSAVNAAGVPSFLKIEKTTIRSKLQESRARVGSPGLPNGGPKTRSTLIFAMLVDLPGSAIYMRLSQALFASVAIAFIAFFIKPTHVDPRFGLGIGAVFASVANNISVQAALPPPMHITILQMAYTVCLATIFFVLVQSAISLYILDTLGREKLYRYFDKASFAVFAFGYTAVNLALPIAASA